ncbi:MAG: hypothetical protein AAF490_14015 [Chloroflexota bacterium]
MLTHNTSSSRTVVGPFNKLNFDQTSSGAQLLNQLDAFEQTSLKTMSINAYHQFSSDKFVFHSGMLEKLLAQLAMAYKVLRLNGRILHQYKTTYFDTDNLTLYHQPKQILYGLEQNQLQPKIQVSYSRAVLLSHSGDEKLTVDLDFTFEWQDEWISLPGLAFIESHHLNPSTPFLQAAKRQNTPTTEKSSYQLGINLLYPEV